MRNFRDNVIVTHCHNTTRNQIYHCRSSPIYANTIILIHLFLNGKTDFVPNVHTEAQLENYVFKIGLKISNIPIKIVFLYVTDTCSVCSWALGYLFKDKIICGFSKGLVSSTNIASVPPVHIGGSF